MKQGNMSFLVSFLTFLLVTASGESAHPNLPRAGGTMVPKSGSTIIAYWQTVLPDSTMPPALLDLLTPPADYGDHISIHNKNNIQMARKLGIHSVVEGKNKYQGVMGSNQNPADLNPAIIYGEGANGGGLNPAIIYGKGADGVGLNPAIIYGKGENGGGLNPAIIYGKGANVGNLNPAIIYGKGANGAELNPAIIYGKGANGGDFNPAIIYGKGANEGELNAAIIYRKGATGGDLNPAIIYGKGADVVGLNPASIYGNGANGGGLNPAIIDGKGATRGDLNPAIIYAKGGDGVGLNPAIIYGKGANGGNLNPATIYGKGADGVGLNPAIIYGKGATGGDLNPAIFYGEGEKEPVHVTISNMPADGHNHVDGGHDHSNLSNIAFLEDVLTPGSKIATYIHPATPRAPLLLRDAAESIPMSTKSFTDILRMFAPASLAMVENIWSVLDLCEHPNPAKGEKKACATSVESMVELAVSVLGTRELRAFSSPDVPVEGRAASKTYRIVAVRAITGTGDTMTCHGVTFPYKVFVCHALNPTRVYSVMVESDGVQEEKMEALVVCHLNTAEFDPRKLPPHVKPGDGAPVCHFLNRDDILWAPAATTVGRQGAAVAAQ